jgi:hypothetical protein
MRWNYKREWGIAAPFFTSTLDRDVWSVSRPGHITLPPRPGIRVIVRAPEPAYIMEKNTLLTLPGMQPRPSSLQLTIDALGNTNVQRRMVRVNWKGVEGNGRERTSITTDLVLAEVWTTELLKTSQKRCLSRLFRVNTTMKQNWRQKSSVWETNDHSVARDFLSFLWNPSSSLSHGSS